VRITVVRDVAGSGDLACQGCKWCQCGRRPLLPYRSESLRDLEEHRLNASLPKDVEDFRGIPGDVL
jgi:hypothetical protein